MPRLSLNPPLLNSATPWATTLEQLTELYNSPYTGAVTTRTTTLKGFAHDPATHTHVFFTPASSINTYGYSPFPLSYYLQSIGQILSPAHTHPHQQKKPFIISITGAPNEITSLLQTILGFMVESSVDIWVEVNLSCPNIHDAPPPAYDVDALRKYLHAIERAPLSAIPIGIKIPPYTHPFHINALATALKEFQHLLPQLRFITATNTLGGGLHLAQDAKTGGWETTLPGTGHGGLGGEAVHAIALGNVKSLRTMLDSIGMEDVVVIGVGGVMDADGAERMRTVGAAAVGVGTALGREGVSVFEKIAYGLAQNKK